MEYIKDGVKHMQLKFYIEGSEPGLKGIVHSESKEVCGPAAADSYVSLQQSALLKSLSLTKCKYLTFLSFFAES